MANKKIAKKIEAKISKKSKNGAEREQIQELGERVFEEPPCNVGFAAGFTKNLGDFNSVKVQVMLNVPCAHDEIEATFEFNRDWVDAKIDELWEDIEVEEPKKKKTKKKKRS